MTGVSLPRDRSVEECLHHWRAVIGAERDDWTRSFALSIARQAKRRNWKPSPRQLGVMRRLVADLFNNPDRVGDVDIEVIDFD